LRGKREKGKNVGIPEEIVQKNESEFEKMLEKT